jgi:hypothetical protein
MMKEKIDINTLPMVDLAQIGLYKDGEVRISSENIQSLVQGRKTDLLMLTIKRGNDMINLPAKISFIQGTLKIHPIYKTPQYHPLLSDQEANLLMQEKKSLIHKPQNNALLIHQDSIYIEYDSQTREFASYSSSALPNIQMVNNIALNDKQQKSLSHGDSVVLQDGSHIQFSIKSGLHILSDKKEVAIRVSHNNESTYYIIKFPEHNIAPQRTLSNQENTHTRKIL